MVKYHRKGKSIMFEKCFNGMSGAYAAMFTPSASPRWGL